MSLAEVRALTIAEFEAFDAVLERSRNNQE